MLKLIYYILILLMFFFSCKEQTVLEIDYPNLLRLMESEKNNLIILDVRTEEEFKEGHIPQAFNLPVDELEKKWDVLNKQQKIVVYCRSGRRSQRAALFLSKQGFEKVYDFGGLNKWQGLLSKGDEP